MAGERADVLVGSQRRGRWLRHSEREADGFAIHPRVRVEQDLSNDPHLAESAGGVRVCASDSLSMSHGSNWLEETGHVEELAGDVLFAKETLIAHQCCCVSESRAEGAAAAIFQSHPEADVYRMRRERGRCLDVPGTISVHGRIVNMYGQFCPGRPRKGSGSRFNSRYAQCFAQLPGISDTPEERFAWFCQCLEQLPQAFPAGTPRSVAFPAKIGCGLSGGHWPKFHGAICRFAKAHPDIHCATYDITRRDENGVGYHQGGVSGWHDWEWTQSWQQ